MLDSYYHKAQTTDSLNQTGNESNRLAENVEKMIQKHENSQPVRKIRANRRSITGWINGYPNHEAVPFESSIERDCAYQLLFDRRIQQVQSQPLTVTFPTEYDKDRFYTPDYLVSYEREKKPTQILIECKPQKTWTKNKERLTNRYSYVSEWAKERGMQFVLLTDQHVQGISLQNIKLLYPQRLVGPNVPGYAELRSFIWKALPGSITDVLDQTEQYFPSRAEAITELLSMIANYKVVCDLNLPIEMTTLIHKAESNWEPPFLFDQGIYF